jgi:hypothetical protein
VAQLDAGRAVVIRDDEGNILVARWADTQAWDLPSGPLRVGDDTDGASWARTVLDAGTTENSLIRTVSRVVWCCRAICTGVRPSVTYQR